MMAQKLKPWRWLIAITFILLVAAGWRAFADTHSPVPEVALSIGQPWEEMRKNSSARIDPTAPEELGTSWFRVIEGDARMRFVDPQYGFVTPRAKFFTISYDSQKVSGVRMSPQVETLPLDEALKVVLDLQEQWEKAGWKLGRNSDEPKFEDTPQWRENLLNCMPNASFWRVPDRYQTQLDIGCFADQKHPNEKRFLITLELSKPYGGHDEGKPIPTLQPFTPVTAAPSAK